MNSSFHEYRGSAYSIVPEQVGSRTLYRLHLANLTVPVWGHTRSSAHAIAKANIDLKFSLPRTARTKMKRPIFLRRLSVKTRSLLIMEAQMTHSEVKNLLRWAKGEGTLEELLPDQPANVRQFLSETCSGDISSPA